MTMIITVYRRSSRSTQNDFNSQIKKTRVLNKLGHGLIYKFHDIIDLIFNRPIIKN